MRGCVANLHQQSNPIPEVKVDVPMVKDPAVVDSNQLLPQGVASAHMDL